jgi:hypothetical protein
VQHPCRFDISRLVKTLGSVATHCYSHLSDDEREQIGLAKALGNAIGAIAQAIGRPKSTISRELSRNKLPSGRYSLIEQDRSLRTWTVLSTSYFSHAGGPRT